MQNDYASILFNWNKPWLAKLQVRVKRKTHGKYPPVVPNWNHAKFSFYEHFRFHKTHRFTFRENEDHLSLVNEFSR